MLTTTHLKLATKQLILQLWDRGCYLAVFVFPLINSGGTVVVIVVP